MLNPGYSRASSVTRLCVVLLASLFVIGALSALPPNSVYAQGDNDAAKPAGGNVAETQSDNMLIWVIKAAGIFFVPQLFISFVVIGMIVLYFIQIRAVNFVPKEFLDDFDKLHKDKKFQDAYELARKEESFVGKMVAAGISKLSTGYTQAVESMEEVAEDETMKHEHRLSYLAMMGNLATMVGLLGTVWGMVQSFMVISRTETAPKPNELAEGVSTALVTTVWGLLQAIPAILFHTILKNRATRMGFEASVAGEELISRFSSQAKKQSS